jgi:hypothetical protein
LIGRLGASGRLIGRFMPNSPRTGRWRGSADGAAVALYQPAQRKPAVDRAGWREWSVIGRFMPYSPRTGRWRGSADGNARRRLISRLGQPPVDRLGSARVVGCRAVHDVFA